MLKPSNGLPGNMAEFAGGCCGQIADACILRLAERELRGMNKPVFLLALLFFLGGAASALAQTCPQLRPKPECTTRPIASGQPKIFPTCSRCPRVQAYTCQHYALDRRGNRQIMIALYDECR
jgi:hypothetical protein